MREQSGNPAFLEYGHLLENEQQYPAKWVDIFWNRDESGRVRDVEAVFVPREQTPDGEAGERFWTKFARYNSRWTADLGNSLSNWMQPGGYTPAVVFGHLLETGFASRAELQRALEEFAHIEECEWARDMFRSFRDDEEDGED